MEALSPPDLEDLRWSASQPTALRSRWPPAHIPRTALPTQRGTVRAWPNTLGLLGLFLLGLGLAALVVRLLLSGVP